MFRMGSREGSAVGSRVRKSPGIFLLLWGSCCVAVLKRRLNLTSLDDGAELFCGFGG